MNFFIFLVIKAYKLVFLLDIILKTNKKIKFLTCNFI